MRGYKAVLFAQDGEWITDFRGDTKEEVVNLLANRGSVWYFYPLEAIVRDWGGYTTAVQRIADAPYPLDRFIGRAIKTVSKIIADTDLVSLIYEPVSRLTSGLIEDEDTEKDKREQDQEAELNLI